VSLESLKLSKQLLTAMTEAGYLAPKEIQSKSTSRMLGGQNIIGVGPQGCGKTTAYILAVLMRLKGPVDGAPRTLILVPTKEKMLALLDQFKWLGKATGIRVSCLTTGLIGDLHMEAIEDGHADIVIGTPDKINALYVKSALNLRSLLTFVVDNAETIVKLNLQPMVYQLSEGLTKCQRLIFTEALNEKVEKLAEHMMPMAELVQVENTKETEPEMIPMILYKTSNYKTKLNLLDLIIRDEKAFTKVAVFVNNREAAEALYNSLRKRLGKNIGILKSDIFNNGFDTLEDFKQNQEFRVIVLCGEDRPSFNLLGLPYIFHMELPAEKEIFIDRIKKRSSEEKDKAVSIVFATNP
jgi:ATP-dependent RNA helicase RhlE